MKCTHGCCHLKTWKLRQRSFRGVIEKPKKKRAGVIIICEDDILVVRSWGGNWGFPKGSIEAGEKEEFSASRELEEETGIFISEEFIKKESVKWVVPQGVFFVLKVQSKPAYDIEKIKDVKNNDSSGVGWVNIRCMLNNCNLPCNKYFRMFLYGVKEDGLSKWLRDPPTGTNHKVYQKVT